MNARRWTFLGTAAATALALTVVVRGRQAVPPSESFSELTAAETVPNDGPREGIRVHGRWTIEVRDPDGRLVTRREFDNAVPQTGRVILSNWLGRQWTLGAWEVLLNNFDAAQRPCATGGGDPAPCIIREVGQPEGGQAVATLTISVVGETVVLSGSATAQRDGVITTVSTQPKNCLTDVPAEDCAMPGAPVAPGGVGGALTLTTLAAPIPVQTGQSILATVTFSF